jgi:hypothetical protein
MVIEGALEGELDNHLGCAGGMNPLSWPAARREVAGLSAPAGINSS